MFAIRYHHERGETVTSTISSRHSFTFNRYYNQLYLGWSDLRVINEDIVQAGGGFPTHAHRNQEILTWVLSGQLQHKDSAGNEGIIGKGDLQIMSAGTGIEHSEINPSETDPVHFLQIWIFPENPDGLPDYRMTHFDDTYFADGFKMVAGKIPQDNALPLYQDASVFIGFFKKDTFIFLPNDNRYYWIQIIAGTVSFQDKILQAGDGLHYYHEAFELISLEDNTQMMLFDLRIPK